MTAPRPPDEARTAGGATEDEQLGYEQAREELTRIVSRLETGGVPLEESLALWERGERLAAVCQRWLDGARATIDAARAESRPDEG